MRDPEYYRAQVGQYELVVNVERLEAVIFTNHYGGRMIYEALGRFSSVKKSKKALIKRITTIVTKESAKIFTALDRLNSKKIVTNKRRKIK
ncbi:MAG: hypothetical protein WAV31_04675 [Candidatus Moraniibacteriota bacterium]